MKPAAAWTVKAIFQAHVGAEKLSAQGYRFAQFINNGWYVVVSPEQNRYRVMPFGKVECNCPQGQAEGICKHIVWVGKQLGDEAEEVYHLEREFEARQILRDEAGDADERYWSR